MLKHHFERLEGGDGCRMADGRMNDPGLQLLTSNITSVWCTVHGSADVALLSR